MISYIRNITIQSVSTILFSVSVDLNEDHSRQTRGEAEQNIGRDQREPLYHNEGLMPQEVSQEEDREKEGQVGVCPDRVQVVGQLWGNNKHQRMGIFLAHTVSVYAMCISLPKKWRRKCS